MKSIFSIFVLLTAFSSLISELLQTHILTIAWGGLVFQLTLVFATYVSALGLGSFLHRSRPSPENRLIRLQLFLAISGFATPFILLYSSYFLPSWMSLIISYSFIFWVGLLSGFELPLLNDISETNSKFFIPFEKLMSFDYLGMGFACLAFSTILIRVLGFWNTLFLNVSLNIFLGLCFLVLFRTRISRKSFWINAIVITICAALNGWAVLQTEMIRKITTEWITG